MNELWETISSTNDRAAALACQGAPHGVVIFAREQTSGRGRRGRAWLSGRDAGIYTSLILRPKTEADLTLVTLAAGVAAVRAISDCLDLEIGLKWVNDLVWCGRKIGGILAEMPSATTIADEQKALVLGIGINLHIEPQLIPPELRGKVDSLDLITGQTVNANQIAASVINHLDALTQELFDGNPTAILDAWRAVNSTLGKRLRATYGGTEIEGTAIDVDRRGGLVVELDGGTRVTLVAGEVSIRAQDGSYF